jgi:hypothetical protein
MAKVSEDWRPDFEQAMGEAFGESGSPPVPFEDASPHECCEVIWSVMGKDVTPTRLATLTEIQVVALSRRFGEYFDSEAPSVEQIKDAIARTLARWPVGSIGECS